MDIILITLSFCVRKITPIVIINKYKNADLSPDKKTNVSKIIILKMILEMFLKQLKTNARYLYYSIYLVFKSNKKTRFYTNEINSISSSLLDHR